MTLKKYKYRPPNLATHSTGRLRRDDVAVPVVAGGLVLVHALEDVALAGVATRRRTPFPFAFAAVALFFTLFARRRTGGFMRPSSSLSAVGELVAMSTASSQTDMVGNSEEDAARARRKATQRDTRESRTQTKVGSLETDYAALPIATFSATHADTRPNRTIAKRAMPC